MARRLLLVSVLAALAACAPTPGPAVDGRAAPPVIIADGAIGSRAMGPRDAILAAADAAPRSVPGPFIMPIRASGMDGGRLYLNSEEDYRDQRNVSVAIAPSALAQLERRYGTDPGAALVGRTLLIAGSARRVHIDFTAGGRPTGKYYYQTHIDVRDANQITVLPPAEDGSGRRP